MKIVEFLYKKSSLYRDQEEKIFHLIRNIELVDSECYRLANDWNDLRKKLLALTKEKDIILRKNVIEIIKLKEQHAQELSEKNKQMEDKKKEAQDGVGIKNTTVQKTKRPVSRS